MHRPDLPREIDDIILTCMAREPANRYPNVAELAYALLPFAPEKCRPLADAAAGVLRLVPGGWTPPGRLVSTGAVTVSVRKPEPPADGYATQLVGFSSGSASAESTPTRRRWWVIGLAAATCLGIGIGASALLLRTDGVPAIPESARAEPAPAAQAPPASPPGETPSPAAAMPPSKDAARGDQPAADSAGADVAGAGVAGADVAAPAEKAAAATEPAAAQPSSVEASGDRETQLEERRKAARRQRARARARARRRDAHVAPAPPEASTAPEAPEREPDDTDVKPAPCSVDDPLCAFGTAR
jgi:hypothetical protein